MRAKFRVEVEGLKGLRDSFLGRVVCVCVFWNQRRGGVFEAILVVCLFFL